MMTNRYITSIFCAVIATAAVAQTETPDSIKAKELDEVVVEAQMSKTGTEATTYIPTSKQKLVAQNAIDLLRTMSIPQIKINPIDETVTDNFGDDMAIFINYLKASKEEMTGLRTADVRKVEYLESPTDPRFHGLQKVINIIVQEYAWGGYTKISANENFLTGLASKVNIFSKFTYKRMTYDLYVAADNSNNKHNGSDDHSTYSLLKDGAPFTVNRDEILSGSKFKQNIYPLTFRATYNSEKIQLSNTFGYQYTGNPQISRWGTLTYLPSVGENYTYERNNPQHSNALSYSGSWFFALPRSFSFNVTPTFSYTHTNNLNEYATSNAPTIVRHAREDAYNLSISVRLRKTFSDKHSLLIGGNGTQWHNNLHYTGTNIYDDKFSSAYADGMLGYNFKTAKISLNISGGVSWQQSDINGRKQDEVFPFTHVNLKYSPNSRNMFSAYLQYANNLAGITQKTSDILQENELLYISGNPDVKNCRHTTVNIEYTWMPSNAFNLGIYGKFFGMYDRLFQTYEHYNGGANLIRTWVNDGDYLSGTAGLSLSWNLFNNKLNLYANPEVNFYKITGSCPLKYNPFSLYAQAVYYLKSFYFQGIFQTASKGVMSGTNTKYKSRAFYGISIGWSKSNWNLRLSGYNFFNKGWENSTWEIQTPLFSQVRTIYGNYNHPRINISATYTFGYGKKVQRGNEIGAQQGASSAILK